MWRQVYNLPERAGASRKPATTTVGIHNRFRTANDRRAIMPPYMKVGSIPRKRHMAHRHLPGFRGEGIFYEEVVTTGGFGRTYSICYHLRPPTRVRKAESSGSVPLEIFNETILRHHHLKTGHIKP